mgnify:FL=1|tara:strand:- start:7137 stop:9260 length:2124 start_codon:yes stop_codon:yes gene_type:complete
MANDFESQRIERTSIDDLLKLVQGFQQAGAQAKTRHANKTAALGVQIANANTSDEIANLTNLINKHNADSTSMGYDEYSLKLPFEEKKQIFAQGDLAYQEAEKYYNENNYLTKSSEDLSKEIWSMNWDEMTREISNLNELESKISMSQESGQKYSSANNISGSSLLSSIQDRRGMLESKMAIWEENSGQFMVFDEQGNMDEESLAMYENYKYDILSGNYEEFSNKFAKDIKSIESKYNANRGVFTYLDEKHQEAIAQNLTYGELEDIIRSEKGDKETESLSAALNIQIAKSGRNAVVSDDWFMGQKRIASNNSDKYNNQYKVMTGNLLETEAPWQSFSETEKLFLEEQKRIEEEQKAEEEREKRELDKQYEFGAESDITEEEKFEIEFEQGEGSELTAEDEALKAQSDLDNYVESEASEEGIDYGKVATGVALGGAALASNESVQNFVKATYKATKDGVKYLSTSTRLSAKDIKFIMDDVNNKKGTVNKTLKKIEGLEKQLKNIKKDPYNTKRIQIKNKINELRKGMVESLSKRLTKAGSKVRPEDIARIMSNKEMSKWNPIKFKDYLMNKLPKATQNFIKKNPKKVATAGGLLQFRTGAAIKDALGIDIGEGFVWDTTEDIATTATSTGILNKVGKWLAPKLTSVVTSKAGQKALTKFAGKQAAKNIARQVVGTTVPGWGNIAMAIAGAGLSVRDFIKFIRNYKEE